MLRDLLTAVCGMVVIGLAWLGVQLLIRRNTPGLRPDQDVLEDRVHGCHNCPKEAECHVDPTQCPSAKDEHPR